MDLKGEVNSLGVVGKTSSTSFVKEYVQYSPRFQTQHFRKKGVSWHVTDTSRQFLPKQRLEPTLDVEMNSDGTFSIFRSHLHSANIQTGSASAESMASLVIADTEEVKLSKEVRRNPNYTHPSSSVLSSVSDGLLNVQPKIVFVEQYGVLQSSWVPSIRKYAGTLGLPTLVLLYFFGHSKYLPQLFLGDRSVVDMINDEFRDMCPHMLTQCAQIVYNSRGDSYLKLKHQEKPVVKDENGQTVYNISKEQIENGIRRFSVQDCQKSLSDNIVARASVVNAISELRKCGYAVIGLTNFMPWEDLQLKSPLQLVQTHLDGIITSKDVESIKSHGNFYEAVLKTIQRKASDCFCIESVMTNAEAAASVGINVLVSRREVSDFNAEGFLSDLSTVQGVSGSVLRKYAKQ